MQDVTTLYNTRVVTVNKDNSFYEAVSFKDGKIIDLGTSSELLNRYKNAHKVDLSNRSVLPGFIDSHCHLSFTGDIKTQLSVFNLDNINDILNFIKEEGKKIKKEEALIINGLGGMEIENNNFPTLKQLDLVLDDKPIFLRTAGMHSTIVNSKGLELVIKEAENENIKVGEEDVKDGQLIDKLNLIAIALSKDFMSEKDHKIAREEMVKECLINGVTGVHTLEGMRYRNDKDVAYLLENKDKLPFDLNLYYQTTDVEEVLKLNLNKIGGCFLCLLDGDIDPISAAMLDPYENTIDEHGSLYFKDKDLIDFFKKANRNNLQICIHAVGDGAIDQALRAYEEALKEYKRENHRHRIEHFEICSDDLIKRAKDLDICLGMQPSFDYYWNYDSYIKYIGKRAKNKNAFRKILDAGIIVGGGSDSPVTSMNCLVGIHSCLNHSVKESNITLDEAIRMFTYNSAYLAFDEDRVGSIEIGKDANFAVLSSDIYNVCKEDIDKIQVIETIYRGNTVFKKKDNF